MKYICDFDNEIYDEDDIDEVIDSHIENTELEEAMRNLDFRYIWKHLDDEAQLEIWEAARNIIFSEYFVEADDEEEEDDE